jgi:hypothetical protein
MTERTGVPGGSRYECFRGLEGTGTGCDKPAGFLLASGLVVVN